MIDVERVARRFRVEGRVQGVFYRAAAHAEAVRLGLAGWIRNLPDGSVEAYACGTSAQLAAFEDWLWQGPPRARVTEVTTQPAAVAASTTFVVQP